MITETKDRRQWEKAARMFAAALRAGIPVVALRRMDGSGWDALARAATVTPPGTVTIGMAKELLADPNEGLAAALNGVMSS